MLDWLAVAGAEEKPRLAVTDELNQQLRHVLREVDVTFSIFRFEVRDSGCTRQNVLHLQNE
jgi:hypothetical protein